jgi:hypothetical protein
MSYEKGGYVPVYIPKKCENILFNEMKVFWAKIASFWYINAGKVKKMSINVQFL